LIQRPGSVQEFKTELCDNIRYGLALHYYQFAVDSVAKVSSLATIYVAVNHKFILILSLIPFYAGGAPSGWQVKAIFKVGGARQP
jgi:hypothetical protein